MDGSILGLVEMAFVLFLTLGFGIWQLISVRRAMREPPKNGSGEG